MPLHSFLHASENFGHSIPLGPKFSMFRHGLRIFCCFFFGNWGLLFPPLCVMTSWPRSNVENWNRMKLLRVLELTSTPWSSWLSLKTHSRTSFSSAFGVFFTYVWIWRFRPALKLASISRGPNHKKLLRSGFVVYLLTFLLIYKSLTSKLRISWDETCGGFLFTLYMYTLLYLVSLHEVCWRLQELLLVFSN